MEIGPATVIGPNVQQHVATCGNSARTHNRTCNNPEPQYGGIFCPDSETETEPCTLPNCPGL